MAFAIELFFDQALETAVRQIWQDIAQSGLKSAMLEAQYQPHVSLAVCEALNMAAFAAEIEVFAAGQTPLPISLQNIGIFPTEEGVVFLGVTVTAELLAMHAAFHLAFARHGVDQWDYYLPGQWVPHCTLAYGLSHEEIGKACQIVQRASFPLKGWVRQIAITDVSPEKCDIMQTCHLGRSAASN
jgi:2'-5' RNA ligase